MQYPDNISRSKGFGIFLIFGITVFKQLLFSSAFFWQSGKSFCPLGIYFDILGRDFKRSGKFSVSRQYQRVIAARIPPEK
jgi:hypothetical protein